MAADFLIRLFMIQHDCGHGAFFLRRSTNDWIGCIIGVMTPTPCDFLQLRGASCDLRQSCPPQRWRHRHPHGPRASGIVTMGAPLVPSVPPPRRHVRVRSRFEIDPGLLHFCADRRGADTFNGSDGAIAHRADRQRAGSHRFAVDMDRAGAAVGLPLTARLGYFLRCSSS
jgi:hypothetical protein